MLRELSVRARRRRESNPASDGTATSGDSTPQKSPVRSLTSLPRRLSRGSTSFTRNSSFLSSRNSSRKPPPSQGNSMRTLPKPDLRRVRQTKSDITEKLEKAKLQAEKSNLQVEDSPRVFAKRPGYTVPLVSVDELFKWRPTGLAAKCVSRVPLSESAIKRYTRGQAQSPAMAATAAPPLSAASAARGAAGTLKRLQPPRLLLCHDFKGGYPDWEASADGVRGNDCPKDVEMWRFNHWAYVDIFVYFSHYCVTIPPVGYIHAAHRHGTLCLGTLIFEWESGLVELQKILASFKTRARAASQLAAIAKFYGFDGWLVNVEVELPGGSSAASDLAAFVGDLTRATRKVVGQVSEVIWYDSVTRDGSLKWQNELNLENEQFFKAAGSIFTNYHWDRNAPVRSAVKAGTRRTDVFTGIDIFGRNTYGGGGFQTHIALRAIKQGGTSAALFAPGWTVEKCPPNVKDPRELDERFWTGPSGRFRYESVSQYFKERAVLTELPFSTSFDPGWGPRNMKNGIVKSSDRYFNMAQQQIQPSFLRTCVASGDSTSVELAMSNEEAFNGSTSVKTQFAFSESRMLSGSYSIMRLLISNVTFPTRLSSRITKSHDGALRIKYNYLAKSEKDPKEAAKDFGLVLLFSNPMAAVMLVGEGSKWNVNKQRVLPRLQILGKFFDYEVVVALSDQRSAGAPKDPSSTGWMTRTFTLEAALTSGQRLSEVMIIAGGPPQQPMSVRPSPFISPNASQRGSQRGSRISSRVGSRVGSRTGSRVGSRSNSPPRSKQPERNSEIPSRTVQMSLAQIQATLQDNREPEAGETGDTFGQGLLNKYRGSMNTRRREEVASRIPRGLPSGLERRENSTEGIFQRRMDSDMDSMDSFDSMPPRMADRRDDFRRYGTRQMSGAYSNMFQVEGNIDFDNMMDQENGMYSSSTSRAVSRFGSRFQSPSGSRQLSRMGSRMGSTNPSRMGSLAASLAASRTGSLAASRVGSRAVSRQTSRITSPVATPRAGGGGALPLPGRTGGAGARSQNNSDLGSEMDNGVNGGTTTPSRSGAVLSDLRAALMQAAGTMAGDTEFASGGSGSGACVVYLGGISLELITDDASLPAAYKQEAD